jgi:site-specific DNA-cytosine methylase
MKVLIACEESQAVCIEFRKLGHEAYSCDILPCSGGHPEWHLQQDILEVILGGQFDMMIAFPPCTDLASSGARWFHEKRENGDQERSIIFFMTMVNANIPLIAVENPIGIMSTQYRKPDQIIQPWMFGHPETKSTCLWLKGLPKLISTNIVEPDFMRKANGEYYLDAKGKRYSRIHFMSRSNPNRAMERSKTYTGIARAMAEQWGNLKL